MQHLASTVDIRNIQEDMHHSGSAEGNVEEPLHHLYDGPEQQEREAKIVMDMTRSGSIMVTMI